MSAVSRERLPDRRKHITQKVRIDGQLFYVCVGLYPDGRPGEIFVTAHKMGTFARGVLDAMARSVSLALQTGTPITEVAKSLAGLDFPPNGSCEGSPLITSATSVADFVAQELMTYIPAPEKVAGGDITSVTHEQTVTSEDVDAMKNYRS